MLRVMGAGGGTGVGWDEVTQGAKPSLQRGRENAAAAGRRTSLVLPRRGN